MLVHLSVDNFVIADHLEAELGSGMTAITGETGAGKSILLGALGLTLGDRADSSAVRAGCERADLHATFDISQLPAAREWLAERDLTAGDECLLRRVITREGRSRAYINGRPATLPDLKALGKLLVEIHGQHAHQSLLRKSHQRQQLDGFAGCEALAASVRQLATRHQQLCQQLKQATSMQDEHDARVQLLSYQAAELDELNLEEDELTRLEAEQKELANGEQILRHSQQALALCKEGEINVLSILQQAVRSLQETGSQQNALVEAEQMLGSALIQVEEASRELQRHLDSFELDPARLQEVEARLGTIYDIARKHRVTPAELPELHQQLQTELDSITGGAANIEQLRCELESVEQQYRETAGELSRQRQAAAARLEKLVAKQLKALAMGSSDFKVALTARPDTLHPAGLEEVEFLISTNPGTPAQPLARIASGGELSRISLAIQVVTAQSCRVATMVFDEVDVGIGGATAEVVGRLLRELGARSQVLCVTHQPQVASQAHHHFKVQKHTGKQRTHVTLQTLRDEQKVEEVARMLGGVTITDQSRAHAREMLALTQ